MREGSGTLRRVFDQSPLGLDGTQLTGSVKIPSEGRLTKSSPGLDPEGHKGLGGS